MYSRSKLVNIKHNITTIESTLSRSLYSRSLYSRSRRPGQIVLLCALVRVLDSSFTAGADSAVLAWVKHTPTHGYNKAMLMLVLPMLMLSKSSWFWVQNLRVQKVQKVGAKMSKSLYIFIKQPNFTHKNDIKDHILGEMRDPGDQIWRLKILKRSRAGDHDVFYFSQNQKPVTFSHPLSRESKSPGFFRGCVSARRLLGREWRSATLCQIG
jgi:hypothetical protein